MEVEEFILTSDDGEEGVLAMKDEGPNQSSRTSPMSLVGLLKRSSFWEAPQAKIRIFIHLVLYLFVFSYFLVCVAC